jgi:hypothetical protein
MQLSDTNTEYEKGKQTKKTILMYQINLEGSTPNLPEVV